MDVSRPESQELGNEGNYGGNEQQNSTYKVNFYAFRVGQKLVHLSCPNWVSLEQFFAVSSENTDFPKKIV